MADNINIGVQSPSEIHIGIQDEIIHLVVEAGGGGGGGGGVAIKASGSYSQGMGTIEFETSPTVTFGLDTNGIMTASALQSTHAHPYASSDHTHGSIQTVSIAGSVLTNSSNSSGLTLGMPAWITTAMASQSTSVFQYTSATSNITSAAFPAANTTNFAGIGTSGTNVTMTLNSNGLALSVDPPGAGGGAALKGSGTYTQNSGTIEFVNSNDITFGLTSNQLTASFSQSTHSHPYLASESTSVFAYSSNDNLSLGTGYTTHTHNYQSAGAYLTTAAVSNHTHSDLYINTSVSANFLTTAIGTNYTTHTHNYQSAGAYLTTAMASDAGSLFQYSTDNSLSLAIGYSTHTHNYQSTAAYLTTAAQTNHSHGNPTLALTNLSGTTSSNSAGLTLSLSAAAVGGAQTAISGVGVSNTTYTSGTIIWSADANITIESSVNGGSQYVKLSVGNYITTAAQSDHTHNQYLTTAAVSNHTHSDVYMNTSVSGNFQLTADNSLSLAAGYSTHTHQYQSTGAYLTSQTVDTQFVGLATTGVTGFNVTINSSQLLMSVVDGSIYFNDINGVTFGISTSGSSSTVTASVATNYQSAGAYLTTAMASDGGSIYQLTGDNSLSLAVGYSTHTHNYQSTGAYLTTGALSDHTHSNLYIALANSTAYQTSVLSGTFQTTGAYLTTAAQTDHTHSNLYLPLANSTQWATSVLDDSLMALSYSSAFQTATLAGTFMDKSYSSGFQTATLSNTFAKTDHTHSNLYIALGNSTFYQTTNLSSVFQTTGAYLTTAANSTHTHDLQSTGAYLTTAAQVSHTHGSISTASTAGTAFAYTSASGGMTFGLPAWITTYAAGGSIDWATATTNAGTAISISTGAATNTLIYPKYITGYTESTHDFTKYAGIQTTGITGGSATINSSQLQINIPVGTVAFVDSNNITFGSSVNGVSTTITASVNTGGGGSVYAGDFISLSTVAGSTSISVINTASFTSSAMNTSERANYFYSSNNTFANDTHTHGGLTINVTNLSTSLTSASNGLTINISAANPGAGGGVAVAAAGATISNSTVVFSNSNGVSFGGNGSTITAQIAGVGTVYYSDGSGVSWGSSVDGASTTITASVNAAGGVSWQLAGNNTSGTTASNAGGTVYFSGGPGITLSGNSNTIVFSKQNQVISRYEPVPYVGVTRTAEHSSRTWKVYPFVVPQDLSASYLRILVSAGVAASTTIGTYNSTTLGATRNESWYAVIYTRGVGGNSKSLQYIYSNLVTQGHSWSVSCHDSTASGSYYTLWQSMNLPQNDGTSYFSPATTIQTTATNISISQSWSSAMTGPKYLDIPFATSLSAGDYWIAFGKSVSTAVAGTQASRFLSVADIGTQIFLSGANNAMAYMGMATNATNNSVLHNGGIWTTNVQGTTASINLAQVSSVASHNVPYFVFIREA